MNRKSKYIEFCGKQPVPLHVQPWWLDAVCGSNRWDVALTCDANGRVIGALPYFIVRKWGLRMVKMPPLTDYVGAVLCVENQEITKNYAQESFRQKVLADLISQLPKTAFWYQQFYPEMDNWLPFMWAGWRQTTTYTYRLERLQNTDHIFANFKATVRTNIRRAAQLVQVEFGDDINAFYNLYSQSLTRRGVRLPFEQEILQRVDAVLSARQQRQILFARNPADGVLHAALYVAHDAETAYFLLWGIQPAHKQSHAIQLLFWTAIQQLAPRVQHIDFCGSDIPDMEKMIRSFGGVRRPCSIISRTSNRFLHILSILLNRHY
ncbi:MAG TPA: GNAT family N-acetyltransferase [Saprospiraceae bacterium]|nr:GNAT family N-acetyltransferase [Saprospiraceae bacterium]HMP22624.1 GNAT family N-acetyltransferase [Saprospiraceae bacterium]